MLISGRHDPSGPRSGGQFEDIAVTQVGVFFCGLVCLGAEGEYGGLPADFIEWEASRGVGCAQTGLRHDLVPV